MLPLPTNWKLQWSSNYHCQHSSSTLSCILLFFRMAAHPLKGDHIFFSFDTIIRRDKITVSPRSITHAVWTNSSPENPESMQVSFVQTQFYCVLNVDSPSLSRWSTKVVIDKTAAGTQNSPLLIVGLHLTVQVQLSCHKWAPIGSKGSRTFLMGHLTSLGRDRHV